MGAFVCAPANVRACGYNLLIFIHIHILVCGAFNPAFYGQHTHSVSLSGCVSPLPPATTSYHTITIRPVYFCSISKLLFLFRYRRRRCRRPLLAYIFFVVQLPRFAQDERVREKNGVLYALFAIVLLSKMLFKLTQSKRMMCCFCCVFETISKRKSNRDYVSKSRFHCHSAL